MMSRPSRWRRGVSCSDGDLKGDFVDHVIYQSFVFPVTNTPSIDLARHPQARLKTAHWSTNWVAGRTLGTVIRAGETESQAFP
jgi:hypothetical protein